jgi:hypothetical protein
VWSTSDKAAGRDKWHKVPDDPVALERSTEWVGV